MPLMTSEARAAAESEQNILRTIKESSDPALRARIAELEAQLADANSHVQTKEDVVRETMKTVRERIISLREGNMMLDNEPILFVKGYEQAVADLLVLLSQLVTKKT